MTRHVKTTDEDDGGCLTCDECDRKQGHAGDCDCDCIRRAAEDGQQ